MHCSFVFLLLIKHLDAGMTEWLQSSLCNHIVPSSSPLCSTLGKRLLQKQPHPTLRRLGWILNLVGRNCKSLLRTRVCVCVLCCSLPPHRQPYVTHPTSIGRFKVFSKKKTIECKRLSWSQWNLNMEHNGGRNTGKHYEKTKRGKNCLQSRNLTVRLKEIDRIITAVHSFFFCFFFTPSRWCPSMAVVQWMKKKKKSKINCIYHLKRFHL